MQFLGLDIDSAMRGLWAALCQPLYSLIAWLFDLFMNISRAEILTEKNIEPIYQRITMILAIVMVFYVTFEAVKYAIQPDTFSDKEKGASKLVLKMVLVVLLIAFVPRIFTGAMKFQNIILENQIFSKVILGKKDIDAGSYGKVFSSNMLGLFYYADTRWFDESDLEKGSKCDGVPCKMVVNINLSSLATYGEIPLMSMGLDASKKVKDPDSGEKVKRYYINFDGFFAVGIGIFIAYILVLYCVDAGVRVAQLTFLQVIAPIPIIGYLSPKKDGIFEKWMKQCITTYIDLFLRVGIIYFVLLICQILAEAYSSGDLFKNIAGGADDKMKVFMYIAILMGLLLFAKKAPDMLKELFPKSGAASGNFGLKPGDRVAPLAARGAGMAIGAGMAGAKGLIGGGINRAKRNRMNRKTGKTREDKENYKQSRDDLKRKKDQLKRTQDNYRRNRHTMTDAERKQAEKQIREEKQNVRDARIEKESARAAKNNSKQRNAILTGIGEGIGGVARGAYSGIQAKDLGSIGKQVSQGWKNESAALEKTEKWYNEGGGSGFDRMKTSIEKGLGISTTEERMSSEIKGIDEQIKTEEALISSENDVKTKTDAAKDRSGSKLEKLEQKTKVASGTSITYKDIDGHSQSIDTSEGGTTSSIYSKYQQKTMLAKSKADEAAKAAQKAKQLSLMDPDNTEKARAAQIAEQMANQEAEEAAKAERNQGQVKKALEEYAMTKILQDPNPQDNDEHDGALIDKIKDIKTSIELSKRNRDTVTKMQSALSDNEEAYRAYMSGNIQNYKQLDDIQTALGNIANDRAREVSTLKETKRRQETSDAYAAAKADSSASGKH